MRILLEPAAAPPAGAPPKGIAPPTPAPAPTPTPKPEPTPPAPPAASDDPFAELDAKFAKAGTPPPAPPAPKGDDAKPTPTPDKTKATIKEPKELRAELDRVKTELAGKTQAESDLRAKIADYERKGKDTEALVQRLQGLEKEMAAKEGQIRALKHEASPEFKEKWDKPFEQRVKFIDSRITQLTVTDPETQAARPATPADFDFIYRLPYNKAIAQSKEMFGDASGWVIQQMTELQQMEYNRTNALTEERQQWQQRQTEEDGRRVQERETWNSLVEKANADLGQSVEDYHNDPTDKELTDLRNQGFAVFDAQPKTAQQAVLKAAHMRQRIAAFGPLKLRLQRAETKIAELEAELAEAKPKPPTPGKRPGGAEHVEPKEDWAEGLRKSVT